MLDEKYITFIKDEALNLFTDLYIIDIASDNVYECEISNSNVISKNKISFFDFAEDMKLKLEESCLKQYFDNISSGNIQNNGGSIVFETKLKNSDNDFSKYVNYASLLPSSNQVVMVASFKEDFASKDEQNLKCLEERLAGISNRVSDVILKIYNTLDSVSENANTSKYISILLDSLIREFPEFNKQFEKNMVSQVNKTTNTLLIVDDDPMTRKLIQKTFSEEYEIIVATNGKEAIDILERTGTDNIVGIFLDLLMPVLDGFAVLDYLREKNILSKLPIVIISGTEDKQTRQRVYQYNISDLLEKPFNLEVIKYRTTNLINLYKTSNALNNIIISQNADLLKVIDRLVESYKIDNKQSIDTIKKYLKVVLENVKITYPEYKLNDYIINKIILGFELYDVGLYIYPKNFNFYKDNLTYKDYPKLSSIIVSKYFSKHNDKDLYNYSNDICLYHNELFDGSGYPFGLVGDKIPICAQCVSITIYLKRVIDSGMNDKNAILNWFNSQSGKFNSKLLNILDTIIENIDIEK